MSGWDQWYCSILKSVAQHGHHGLVVMTLPWHCHGVTVHGAGTRDLAEAEVIMMVIPEAWQNTPLLNLKNLKLYPEIFMTFQEPQNSCCHQLLGNPTWIPHGSASGTRYGNIWQRSFDRMFSRKRPNYLLKNLKNLKNCTQKSSWLSKSLRTHDFATSCLCNGPKSLGTWCSPRRRTGAKIPTCKCSVFKSRMPTHISTPSS